ncbi:threonine ammonia-lyase [Futiania mangrovi]|uniref:Threonine/serine dehydratase n=1 Tax=Futiania mangrovi TaxID=2959716 RepID=A0A9J6PED5_9PROT|nr:threonine/serine dehydratase [Futiania mangrovii]MCP1336123.1 threonine/serine dehydratase [Futiania mangrovii]
MTVPLAHDLPTFADIADAARALEGHAVRTPLIEADLLNAEAGRRILVKAEALQRTGSFKFRGAYNRIRLIPEADRTKGVIAYSSGNHAQGVALAARLLGAPATIIMPADAPALKKANTEAYGATVVTYDRWNESREEIGERLVAETGATLVRPYDDRHVIAGQGTSGLEIAEECAARGIRPDAVLVCCGGGGLTSGIVLALAKRMPGVPVYAVEPAGFDDWRRSLEAGARVANDPSARSICDAIVTPTPGEITWAISATRLAGAVAVSDAEAEDAMRVAFRRLKLVVEPGGAVALAAALSDRLPGNPRTVVAVASGGNVDADLYARVIGADA